MLQTHSLTAYRCNFSYMERNNPIETDEMNEAIKNGDKPDYSLCSFISDYIDTASSLAEGQNANRAILLTQITSTETLPNNVTRTHIQPQAGKYGEPVTVIKRATKQSHKYGIDDAALYDYNVFFYENEEEIIAIFHRKGTAGCKTVFLETANTALREKGMRLTMKLIVPLDQCHDVHGATPSQVTLKWLVPIDESSDIADNLDDSLVKKKQKTRIVQNLTINLKADESNPIKKIVENLRNNHIDEKTALAEITAKYLGDDNRGNFNDAIVDLKIGNRIVSKIRFGEIENQIGAYNITNALDTANPVKSLIVCADAYYMKIAEG